MQYGRYPQNQGAAHAQNQGTGIVMHYPSQSQSSQMIPASTASHSGGHGYGSISAAQMGLAGMGGQQDWP